MKNTSKILALVLSLALIFTVFATVPFVASAEATTAPTKPADATDYADSITGFCGSCYGVGAGDMPAWNTATKGATFPNEAWGATLAQGYSVPSDKEGYVSVSALPDAVDSNYGIVFRSAAFGNPGAGATDIFSVFVSNTAVTVKKYHLNAWDWGSSDDVVTSASYSRSAVAAENVVIKSTASAVSVWVDGVQYIDEAAISAGGFAPVVGFWFPNITVSDVSFWTQDIPPEPVPVKPEGNKDYIDFVSGWNGPYWAQGNADYQPAWNDATNGFTVDKPGNGALVTAGYNVPQSKTAVLSVDLSDYSGGRTDIIFRGMSCTDYWAAYIYPDGHGFLSHVVNCVEQVNFADFTFTPAASGTDTFVIKSGNNAVSMWVNGEQVLRDYAQTIDTVNYAASCGLNTSAGVPATISNASLFCLEEDLGLNEAVPTDPVCFVNEAESITGFTDTMWGLPASSLQPWDAEKLGFTMTGSFGNGAYLTTGTALTATDTVIMKADVTATTGRVDLIFRAYSNMQYYALYVWNDAVQLYKYDYFGGGDIFVASSEKAYTRADGDQFVIRSGGNKVSIWINGEQYFRNVAIDTDNFSPLFGLNQNGQTNGVDSIDIENIQLYSVDASADSHTAGEAINENVTPTGYDAVVYCDVCGKEISRDHIDVIPGNLSVATQRKGNDARFVVKLTGDAADIEAYENITIDYSIDGVNYSTTLDSIYDSFINEEEVVTAESLSCTYVAILEIGDVTDAASVVATASYTANGETVIGPTRITSGERIYDSWQ